MSQPSKPFAFTDFVPGFDFLKNLSLAGGAGAMGATPGAASQSPSALSNWIAPTFSVEEVEKRLKELKTVQFWLEQNLHALKATIQAVEVQKMTLSTLRGMNLRMEDLAQAFTRGGAAATTDDTTKGHDAPRSMSFDTGEHAANQEAEKPPASVEMLAQTVTALAPNTSTKARPVAAKPTASGTSGTSGIIDPMQWWGALTQTFEQIASTALRDAATMRLPAGMPSSPTDRQGEGKAKRRGKATGQRSVTRSSSTGALTHKTDAAHTAARVPRTTQPASKKAAASRARTRRGEPPKN
ncbi:MAG: PhaM family polyhydroxyalkanoate granule multifunctional regulatory protein [Variovorax sp.]